ncbi:MAG: hypothetical protein LBH00_10020 [Planctomycetaceae bacterium]|jgi:outer membrane protein assembly factor BamB|nr:hypothetical protein [Planctomycetaceae bacterium]
MRSCLQFRFFPLFFLFLLLAVPFTGSFVQALERLEMKEAAAPAKPDPAETEVPKAEEGEKTGKDGEEKKDREDQMSLGNPIYESLFAAERTIIRRFEQAQRLLEAGRSAEAVQLFGSVLENAPPSFVPPEKTNGDTLRTLDQTMNDQFLQMLRECPKEVLQSYLFQYEAVAKRLLENAAAAGSIRDVCEVAQKYFATEAGAAAAFLVGTEQAERGDYAAAFLTFNKLKQFHPALPKSFEPALSETVKKLQSILDQQKNGQRKEETVSEADWIEWSGWRIPTGSPAHNPNTKASPPLVEECWEVPLFSRVEYEREAELLMRLIRKNPELYVPTAQPIVVGNRLITKSFSEIFAVDIDSGKRLWAVSPPEFQLPAHIASNPPYNEQLHTTLRLFGWHNRIAQQLSSDGERFYSIEDHELISMRDYGNRPMLRDGKIEDKRYAAGNTLTARDVKTGQIVWQIGKYPYAQKYLNLAIAESDKAAAADTRTAQEKQEALANRRMVKGFAEEQVVVDDSRFTEDELAFRETWFLGAPLPLHNRLYIIGENDGIVQLFVLENGTGKLIARLPLAQALTSASAATGVIRRSYPLFPAAAGGILLCPTSSGLIVAVDVMTITPLWCFTYLPAAENEEDDTNGNGRQKMRMMRKGMQLWPGMQLNDALVNQVYNERGWQVPTIMVDRQRVLITPADRTAIYCLDLLTGKLLWEKPSVPVQDNLPTMQAQQMPGAVPNKPAAETKKNKTPAGIGKNDALYVACIHNNKVFTVGAQKISAYDMDTGAAVKFGGHFPTGLLPAGTGIHHDNQYMIPFSGGYLALFNLDSGETAWMNADGSAGTPAVPENDAEVQTNKSDPNNHLAPNGLILRVGGGFSRTAAYPNRNDGTAVFAPDLVANGIFPKVTQYGNLVGVKGMIFSQTAVQIAAFEQKETLRHQAEDLLKKDTGNADALFDLAKIKKSEKQNTEALELLRRSLAKKKIPEAVEMLKDILLESIRNQYRENPDIAKEIESLALFPEDLGNILYAQIEGMIKSQQTADMKRTIEKVLATAGSPPTLVSIGKDHSAQLYRAVGSLLEKYQREQADPALKTAWEQMAKDCFNSISEKKWSLQPDAEQKKFVAQWDKNVMRFSPEINTWQAFTEIFRHTEIAGEANRKLQTICGQQGLGCSLDAEKTPVSAASVSSSDLWKKGNVILRDDVADSTAAEKEKAPNTVSPVPGKPAETVQDENTNFRNRHLNPKIGRVCDALANNSSHIVNANEMMKSPRSVPLLEHRGSARPIFQYFFEITQTGMPYLTCYDVSGEQQWRLALPMRDGNGYTDNFYSIQQTFLGFFDQTIYLKGVGHLLVLVWEDMLAAIDTLPEDQSSPKILWTKRLDVRLPCLQNGAAAIPATTSFPNSSVYVSRQIVCCRDSRYLYGLDPLTGQTLWIRKNPHDLCSVFGDQDNLFLVFPETLQAVALDPSSGTRLAGGTIPPGCFYAYGTNLLFLKNEAQSAAGSVSIHRGDLRDLYDKRRLALVVTDSPQGGIASLPVKVIQSGLDPSSIVQMLNDDQYMAVLNWGKKSLQIFNLGTLEPLLTNAISLPLDVNGVNNDGNPQARRAAIIANAQMIQYSGQVPQMPVDVELVDDKVLVSIVKSQNLLFRQEEIKNAGGAKFLRQIQPIHGIPSAPVGEGTMMLYDKNGKTCWEKPAEIKNWFRLLNIPDNLPIQIFVVSVNDREATTNRSHMMFGLMGVDKRTGNIRFKKLVPPNVPNDSGYLLQDFRVAANPHKQEILFMTARGKRIIRAVFTDDAVPASENDKEDGKSSNFKGDPSKDPTAVKPPEERPAVLLPQRNINIQHIEKIIINGVEVKRTEIKREIQR